MAFGQADDASPDDGKDKAAEALGSKGTAAYAKAIAIGLEKTDPGSMLAQRPARGLQRCISASDFKSK